MGWGPGTPAARPYRKSWQVTPPPPLRERMHPPVQNWIIVANIIFLVIFLCKSLHYISDIFSFIIKTSLLKCKKSCYDSAHICPLRAEISTHEYLENVFILLFVWLVVIGFRQIYFHISRNFGDFGAKMSFFRYIINQKYL